MASLLADTARSRIVGLVLMVVSIGLIGVSTGFMALRLSERNKDAGPVPFATVSASETAFDYRGHRFELDNVQSDDGTLTGLVVRWDDAAEPLEVTGRDNPVLPGLTRHMDWLSVQMIVEEVISLDGITERVLRGDVNARFVVVARAPAPGHDRETWGAAHYKDWVYTYLELRDDGTIERSERTYREIASDVRSWRHVAAMKVTGGLNTPSSRGVSPISYPNYAGVREAMRAMGWTWPAFGVGAAGSIAGVILFLGSFVHRPSDPAGIHGLP